MLIRLVKWLLRRRNYCAMCMSRGIRVGFRCSHGHITCTECASVGVKVCQHHFCTDTKQYFEPDLVSREVEELREQNRRLRRAIEREPPQPLVVQPYVREQEQPDRWQPSDWQDPPHQPYTHEYVPVPRDQGVWRTADRPANVPPPQPYISVPGATGGPNTIGYTWGFMTNSADASD